MIPELLKYLSNKSNYYSAKRFIPRDSLPKEARNYFDSLEGYFSSTYDEDVNIGDWSVWYGMHKPIDELMQLTLDAISAASVVDSAVVQKVIDKLTASDVLAISEEILDGSTKYSVADIDKRLQKHIAESVSLDKDLAPTDNQDFLSGLESIEREGYLWPLNFLQNMLGPLNNEFIIVGARPDGGKTTLMMQCAWFIATQFTEEDDCVLWFNNEEKIEQVKLRFACSILAEEENVILDNKIDSVNKINKVVDINNRIRFVDDAKNIFKIQRLVRENKPKLIIIDQLFKVEGSLRTKDGNEAERYRSLCEWARDVAKHSCPVIVSSQLDATAQGVKYPTMEALYMSKTGAQGEADAIIMVGSVPSEPSMRYIHTPKNKLTGKNFHAEAFLRKDIARFEDA